ncbi:type I-C CRISPR-associated protein Cas8c/Csd1 [Microbulbifer halophilus]|uniref:Type I-C CRISPR-associated protein Cas8c/Csd1 n=1 Tax=Microbulbifer halophilus TaxID=453963 RepID=A0ABW5EAB7_9GAMM|nr:type I-C CRISPR-associated protein Cas8c/Csd1 [Microbulbifer halophilus]MCW8125117.1 type I-C CRISPR-associated protein Cas8c/Csd1 [Microbulbifer halophilus]
MILSALDGYYHRLIEEGKEGVAPIGFSQEKVSYALILAENGSLVDVQDVRDTSGKKPVPAILTVPQPPKRSANIAPCFLWDKSSYVLGAAPAGDQKSCKRALEAHRAFKDMHRKLLKECNSLGIKALLAFFEWWTPETFRESSLFSESMLDGNFVFRMDGEMEYLHECQEGQSVRQAMLQQTDSPSERCLVTGENQPVALLHPSIKGVYGAQTAGASIVSFNLDAFTSYGKSQGQNAPISEQAAFAYTTVLNHLLRKGSRQRLQLGDTSVIFWAEAGSADQAKVAEGAFADLLNPPTTDASETDKLRPTLEAVAKGRPLRELDPELEDSTKLYVLGLAPNASRLSVRFWETGSLRRFAERLAQHYQDLEIKPLPWKTEPSIWRLLLQTVPHREGSQSKSDDIPPQLAGEMTRAILTGRRYPRSLLSNLIMRMRADGDVSLLRVALCKAVLTRDSRIANTTKEKEIPMSLDTDNPDPGYLLGRLFAALENIQQSALGRDINATIRDRYYGAASATPASVFPVLVRNAQNHLSRLRKDNRGAAVNLEKDVNEIVDKLPASFPKSLRIEAQGRFAIGYYHQNKARFDGQKSNAKEGEGS